MNLDSNIMRDVGMEQRALLGKGKKGHRLETTSFHLTGRACVCVLDRSMVLLVTQSDLERDK